MIGPRCPVSENVDRVVGMICYEVPVAEIREALVKDGVSEDMAFFIYVGAKMRVDRMNQEQTEGDP